MKKKKTKLRYLPVNEEVANQNLCTKYTIVTHTIARGPFQALAYAQNNKLNEENQHLCIKHKSQLQQVHKFLH
jgi:hypothetical protein